MAMSLESVVTVVRDLCMVILNVFIDKHPDKKTVNRREDDGRTGKETRDNKQRCDAEIKTAVQEYQQVHDRTKKNNERHSGEESGNGDDQNPTKNIRSIIAVHCFSSISWKLRLVNSSANALLLT